MYFKRSGYQFAGTNNNDLLVGINLTRTSLNINKIWGGYPLSAYHESTPSFWNRAVSVLDGVPGQTQESQTSEWTNAVVLKY